MQTKKTRSFAIAMLATICVTLLSFSALPGGDSVEIYLNKKLVMQQYLYKDAGTKTVPLQTGDELKQLDVRYSHCGVAGKGRSIVIKDGQNKTLKKWDFADAKDAASGMIIPVKDIPGKLKDKENKVHLYYSSREIPEGKLLASIVFTTTAVASRKAK